MSEMTAREARHIPAGLPLFRPSCAIQMSRWLRRNPGQSQARQGNWTKHEAHPFALARRGTCTKDGRAEVPKTGLAAPQKSYIWRRTILGTRCL